MTAPTTHRQWRPLTDEERAEYARLTARRTPPPAPVAGRFNHLPRYALLIIGCGMAALIGSMMT